MDTESQRLIDKIQALLADLPSTKMHPESKRLLDDDTPEWVAERRRLLIAALQNHDKDAVEYLEDDVAHACGRRLARRWILDNMRLIVERADIAQTSTNELTSPPDD